MGIIFQLGMLFAGFGVFFAGVGFLWWCSLYKKIHLPIKNKDKE